MARVSAATFFEALLERRSSALKAMIIAAHPDDEALGIGAQLCRFRDLLIVHVTDGAPRDGHDAGRYGFASLQDYAAARRRELLNALIAGEASHARVSSLDIPDQEACRDLTGLARCLAEVIASEAPVAVITHAYEGGHPDHDASAFAAHAACHLIGGGAPPILEMALYHRRDGQRGMGNFLELSSQPERGSTDPHFDSFRCGSRTLRARQLESDAIVLALDSDDVARKQRMIDAFVTQRWLLSDFPLDCERLRIAPEYDFRRPPHPGVLHYETLGWDIDGARWRTYATAALAALGLQDLPCL